MNEMDTSSQRSIDHNRTTFLRVSEAARTTIRIGFPPVLRATVGTTADRNHNHTVIARTANITAQSNCNMNKNGISRLESTEVYGFTFHTTNIPATRAPADASQHKPNRLTPSTLRVQTAPP
ncbi:hypothetical protein D3H35_05740 [Cohnella faecalis]|uniref:Uncharacterized protein n=1 Tax=Cohnella faecalis TaxID=2315694 RepID=A0A398CMC8_9BACL|nr:hypothetical protein D3H35_05740 [Cohnella faecalis]